MTQLDRLPTRITPARIRESIVQIYFKSEIPIEPLVGYLYSVLGQEFKMSYSNTPIIWHRDGLTDQEVQEAISIQVSPQYFFYDSNVKVVLDQRGSLIFNCIGDYIGWGKYGGTIKAIMESLISKGIIKSIYQIGVRYISEFANTDLMDKLRFEFKLGEINDEFNSCMFAISWDETPYLVNLNLKNKLQIKPVLHHPEHEQINFMSLIDVDTIAKNLQIEQFEDFQEKLDGTHYKEKEVFFSLLRTDFLATLNPEYT